jgi:hypothetical protein
MMSFLRNHYGEDDLCRDHVHQCNDEQASIRNNLNQGSTLGNAMENFLINALDYGYL